MHIMPGFSGRRGLRPLPGCLPKLESRVTDVEAFPSFFLKRAGIFALYTVGGDLIRSYEALVGRLIFAWRDLQLVKACLRIPNAITKGLMQRVDPDYSALLLLVGYGLALIGQTSFVTGGQRTFCLFDDAIIALTYERTVVEGYGLSWSRWGTSP